MKEKRAVVGIVENDGCWLMGKKKSDGTSFLSGMWHVPGESLEDGEDDFQALARGFREEAGVEVEVVEYIGEHVTPKHTIVNWYRCFTYTSEITPGSDLDEVAWVAIPLISNLCGDRVNNWWPDEVLRLFDYNKE